MTPEQEDKLVDMIMVTAEVMGHELKPAAVMMMVADLAEFEFSAVANALNRCRKEFSGKLTLKAILDLLAPSGGWLSANEAWSRALPAADERNTVVWTVEARRAWFVALPLIEANDKVGARMAFIAAYDREVGQAKNAGQRPQHEVSPGDDALLRDATIRQAQTEGLLAPPAAQLALPSPEEKQVMAINRNRISEGLRQLANSLAVSGKQRELEQAEARLAHKREANRRFEEQRAATLAAIEAHEEKGE